MTCSQPLTPLPPRHLFRKSSGFPLSLRAATHSHVSPRRVVWAPVSPARLDVLTDLWILQLKPSSRRSHLVGLGLR